MAAGYRVATCPGPWPPECRCIRYDVGYRPLTEGADLLVYSPDLLGYGPDGPPHLLALDTGKAHPDIPLLLVWPGEEEPAGLQIILAEVPSAHVVGRDPERLLALVRELIGPPFEATDAAFNAPVVRRSA